MTKHVSIETISAYIDGEAKDPKSVALHLQQCAQCARLQVELSKISTHLHALPEPDVRADFARHVSARVADDKARKMRPWAPVGVQVALVAGLILAFGWVFALSFNSSDAPVTVAGSGPGMSMEDAILDQLARSEADGAVDADTSAAPSTDDMVAVLAFTEQLDQLADEWEASEDFDTALASLNQAESQQFVHLLAAYVRNGVPGDYEVGGAVGW